MSTDKLTPSEQTPLIQPDNPLIENDRIKFYGKDHKEVADIACRVLAGPDSSLIDRAGDFIQTSFLFSWRWKEVDINGKHVLLNIGSAVKRTGLTEEFIKGLSDHNFITNIIKASETKTADDPRIAKCKNYKINDPEGRLDVDYRLAQVFPKNENKGKVQAFDVYHLKGRSERIEFRDCSIADDKNDNFHEIYKDFPRYRIDVYCDGDSYYLGFPEDAKDYKGLPGRMSPRERTSDGGVVMDATDTEKLLRHYIDESSKKPQINEEI